MNEKTKSVWAALNPFEWLNTVLSLLAWGLGPIMRFLGMVSPPNTDGFEHLQKSDVEREEKIARDAEAAVDQLVKQMSPAEVVRAYARASEDDRLTMDLSALDAEGQDWLLKLDDTDLARLAISTLGGCVRSLEARKMRPLYARPEDYKGAEILTIPTVDDVEEEKRQFVAARVRELFHAPGVANMNPRYIPGSSTLH